jgi:outer membrane protein assembly factor BamB
VLPVRGVADVPSVQAIAAYSGNLYLLDAEGGEVWRYLPAGDGYDSERGGLLGGIAIDDASAIAVDSDIFLLGESGGVRRFQLGVEQRALLRGLDAPPASSAAVAVSTANGRVYIADRGGQRVVVSARSGDFVAQYRHPRFFDLRGLTLSADGTEVLVLTGDGIFAFDVDPDPTAPGR